ncbi:hypothetical protein GCM10027168_04390 [Streptomyces capparidis]
MTARVVVRTLSELCVTAGTLILLFVVYLLYWTGLEAERAMDREVDRLQDNWSQARDPGTGGGGDGARGAEGAGGAAGGDRDGGAREDRTGVSQAPRPRDGRAFAVMHIPRFGDDWRKPVLEGTSAGVLGRGLGHYPGTARLGDRGNFAVAGHRRTHGDPFKDFPRLRPGDAVVISDGTTWYTYRIDRRPHRTLPHDTGVIAPVPAPLDTAATPYPRPGRYLTLTTCDPEWGSSHRLIAWAHLDSTHPVAAGEPEALKG